MALADIRETRRVLRHEMAQVGHWRRLVRARRDLTVARAVRPDRLGTAAAFHLDADALAPVVPHEHLVRIVRGTGNSFPVTDLPQLRAADESLARYESRVRQALMVATDLLVDRLSHETVVTAGGRVGALVT